MKKAQKTMSEESAQRLQEFEEKKEAELVTMKADEVNLNPASNTRVSLSC